MHVCMQACRMLVPRIIYNEITYFETDYFENTLALTEPMNFVNVSLVLPNEMKIHELFFLL